MDTGDLGYSEMLIGIGPFQETLDNSTGTFSTIGSSLLVYRGVGSAVKLVLVNLGARQITILAQNADLGGLSSPADISVELGTFNGEGQYAGTISPKFLKGIADSLNLVSASATATSLVASGTITTVGFPDLTGDAVTLSWGEFSTAFPGAGESFSVYGNRYLYSRNATLNPDGKVALAIIDLDNCRVTIIVRDSAGTLPTTTSGTVFRLTFTDFDESDTL